DSALARCPLAFTLQRACGPVIRNSAPSIKHRWRQAVSATDLADRYPRLRRFPQNRQLLFRCKSPILTHGPRASCGLPAAARSFPFFGFVFVPKSLKLHNLAVPDPATQNRTLFVNKAIAKWSRMLSLFRSGVPPSQPDGYETLT